MPVLDHPHIVVQVQVGISYCNGSHGEGQGHDMLTGELVAAITPPGDFHVELAWPPVGKDAEHRAVEGYSRMAVSHLLDGLRSIPGCAMVGGLAE